MSANLQDIIKALADNGEEIYSQIATVKNVDTSKNTCVVTPINGDPDIYDVKISADAETDFKIIPMVNSTVVITFFNKMDAYVSMVSKVQLYQIKTETEDLKTILSDMIDLVKSVNDGIQAMTVTATSLGSPTGPPNNLASFVLITPQIELIKTRLDNLLK